MIWPLSKTAWEPSQALADLGALIPPGADPAALRGGEAALYAEDPGPAAAWVSALAFALREGLSDAGPGPDDALIWDLHAARLRALSPGPRAILCRGLALRARLGAPTAEGVAPAAADLISTPHGALEAALLPLARDMDAATIASVALADYGRRHEEEGRAIAAGVATGAMPAWTGDGWECLELVSHAPGTTGWLPCTAWILLRALAVGGFYWDVVYTAVEFRWEQGPIRQACHALPPPRRAAILSGFRGVMEREADGAFWRGPLRPDAILPYDGPRV